MQKHLIRKVVFFLLIIKTISFSQIPGFVSINNGEFTLGGERFYPLGTNAYYLHKYACANDTNSIQELFKTMSTLGMNIVRTWAFCDGEDPNNIYILQSAPYTWNEKSFQKLDYVICTAKKYNIKVILTFVNNWNDLGGMNQYLKWYASGNYNPVMQNNYGEKIFSKTSDEKYYEQNINKSITHDDFYKLDTIKTWYKAYIKNILNRNNIFTRIEYKNEETIMAFELANEPESSDKTGKIIYDWASETATFFKSIDKNHLLSTGEEGFDVEKSGFGTYFASWLFDGSKGISFKMNSNIDKIDYCSAHLYAEYGNNINWPVWIYDHQNIASNLKKPFLLGEYGSKQNRIINFNSWLKAVKETSTAGALLWQLAPSNFSENDGFTLKQITDYETCNAIKILYEKIKEEKPVFSSNTFFSNILPNPCFREGYVKFINEYPETVKYSLYNVLGERLISESKLFQKGSNTILINTSNLSNGIYFVKLENGKTSEIKKIAVVK